MSAAGSIGINRGELLLATARATLAADLGLSAAVVPEPTWLHEPGACFVTLRKQGNLRGCIGTLTAYRSLLEDLKGNSRAAAFRDPRFPPLTALELEDVRLEVSVLSALEPISFESEDDLIRQLRPGVDGLVLEFEGHRGTFLPAVWHSLPEPRTFLRKLKAKAQLSEDLWAADIRVERYTTTSYSES